MSKPLTIAIAVATAGRRETLTEVMAQIPHQTRPADRVMVCPARPGDADRDALVRALPDITLVDGPAGLCAQRNTLMHALADVDVVLFLDDDFVMGRDYVAECIALFARHSHIVMTTGEVIADGIGGPGMDMAAAHAALAKDRLPEEDLREIHNGYGCNMAVRMAPVRDHDLRFDERLPFYGWLEDVDFSRRLAAHGRIVRSQRCRGVHMGVKRGRSSGVRLGYSQVANPYYMWRKGSLSARFATVQMGRNLAANFGRLLRPEPWVDRAGRVRGNLMAMGDLLRGQVDPQRICEIN